MEGGDALFLDDLLDDPNERLQVLTVVPTYTAPSVVSCVGCLKSIRNTGHRCVARNMSAAILSKFNLLKFRDWITPEHAKMFDYVRRMNADNLITQNRWVGAMFLEHVRLKHRIRIPLPEYGPVEFATKRSQTSIGQTVTFQKVDTDDVVEPLTERRFWTSYDVDGAGIENDSEDFDVFGLKKIIKFEPSDWRPRYTVEDFKRCKPIRLLVKNN